MATLHIDGQLYKLEPGKLYLVGALQTGDGAAQQPEIALDCTTVEEKHALLDVCRDAVHLIDLKSASGTYVDGKRAAFTKLCLSPECRVVRFGSVKGKLQINKSTVDELHDSSGYNDSGRINTSDNINRSLEDLSTPLTSHITQRPIASFLIPQTELKQPDRRSDSFVIPETQAVMIDSLTPNNNGTFLDNSNDGNEAEISDDFCIPETQEVLNPQYEHQSRNTNHVLPLELSPVQEHPPSQLCVSQDNELDGGTMIRMCTQDFNDTNDDSRDTTESDLLLSSAIIPYMNSPVKSDVKEGNLNKDTAQNVCDANSGLCGLKFSAGISNSNTSNSKVTTSPDRSGSITPDIFEFSSLANEKETSKMLEERMASDTPDLFETKENGSAILAPDKNANPSEIVSEFNESTKSCTPDLSDALIKAVEGHETQQTIQGEAVTVRNAFQFIMPATTPRNPQPAKPAIEVVTEDDEDLIETQPFCVYQQKNPSITAENQAGTEEDWNLQEERSCTPDLFDFVAPTVSKQTANKPNALSNNSLTCNAQVHAAPIVPSQDEDADDDDFLPTQPYYMFKKTVNEQCQNTNKVTPKAHVAQGNKKTASTSKPSTVTSVVSHNVTQMGDEDDFMPTQLYTVSKKNNPTNVERKNIPPGDEDDLIATQVFQPRHKQLNSTLIAGDASKKPQNANSFFESMETTPQKIVTAAKPFKMPEATPVHSSASGSTRGSQNSVDMFCTPQTINAIWGQSENHPPAKAQINKFFLSEDEDDDEERGTFDVLLEKETPLLSAKETKNESIKHQQFKFAFHIETPLAIARNREDRALKRQIKSLRLESSGEPPTKIQRKSNSNNEKSTSTSGGNKEKNSQEPGKMIGTSKKTHNALEQKEAKSSSKTAAESETNNKKTIRNRPADSAKSNNAKILTKLSTGAEKSPQEDSVKELCTKKAPLKSDKSSHEKKNLEVGARNVNEVKKIRQTKSRMSIEESKSSSAIGKETRGRKSTSPKRSNEPNARNLRSRTKSPIKKSAELKIRKKTDRPKTLAEEPEPIKRGRATRSRGATSQSKTPLVETDLNSAVEAVPSVKTRAAKTPDKSKLKYHSSNPQIRLVPVNIPVEELESKSEPLPRCPTRRVTRLNSHINDHGGSKGEAQVKESNITSNQRRKQKTASVDKSASVVKKTKERSDSLTSEVYSRNNSEELPKNTLNKSSPAYEAKYCVAELNNKQNKAETSSRGARKESYSKDMHITADNGNDDGPKATSSRKSEKMKFATSLISNQQLNSILPDISQFLSYTDDPHEFDVLVMETPSRTFKFLVAMASGKPIMHINWLEYVKAKKSTQTRSLQHFLVNEDFQRKYSFNFMTSFSLARKKKLFEGYDFLATSNVKPTDQELKVIIGCAGGTFHTKLSAISGSKSKSLYLISNSEDKRHWHQYRRANAQLRIVDVEGVILAVIRQSLSPLEEYVIS